MTFSDADGVVGNRTPHQSIYAAAPPSGSYLSLSTFNIGSVKSGSPLTNTSTLAPNSGQTVTITHTTSWPGGNCCAFRQVVVDDKLGNLKKTLVACGASDNGFAETVTWDGTDSSNAILPDDIYTIRLVLYTGQFSSTCTTEENSFERTVWIAATESISLRAPQGFGSKVSPGTCLAMTANSLNTRGLPAAFSQIDLSVLNSAPYSQSARLFASTCPAPANYSTGAFSLANQNTNASGKLNFWVMTDPAIAGPVTIAVNAAAGVSSTTTIYDPPPAAPQELSLSPGSILGRFRKSDSQNAVGHRVYWGTASGQYDHELDLGRANAFHIEDVLPNTRYFVVVRAYNPSGLLSDASPEQSLLTPYKVVPTTLSLAGSASTSGATTTARLLATVLDQNDLPVAGVRVRFALDAPIPVGATLTPLEVATDDLGHAETTVTAPAGSAGLTVLAVAQNLSALLRFSRFGDLATPTSTATELETATPTVLPSASPTAEVMATASVAPTGTPTPTVPPAAPRVPVASATTTATPTVTPLATPPTPGAGDASPTATPAGQLTTATATPVPTTPTPGAGDASPTATPTEQLTTATATAVATTPTPTPTLTPTHTPTPTASPTRPPTATNTSVPVPTSTPAPPTATPPPATAVPTTRSTAVSIPARATDTPPRP